MFSGLYHFILGPNPLHPNVWKGRLQPVCLRPFEPKDLSQCLELYAQNEPGRFPEDVRQLYEPSLMKGSAFHLVAELEGKIVASGGIHHWFRKETVVLCFGLVSPEWQGRGLGTALVLARLALLEPSRWYNYHVFIFAVEKSIGFYRRFGFEQFTRWKDAKNQSHPSGHLLLSGREIKGCRKLLKEHEITLPHANIKLPTLTSEEKLRRKA